VPVLESEAQVLAQLVLLLLLLLLLL